ncbi:hypothetical protein MVES1_003768 [Malassezia vespertilionis]|uniref:Fatty acid hydroxylase domain-containing protein n=1 Tax=Malassezia vespertilionis TaxID=2020962 RepID=A0A2N1J8V8_9BASI|nr:uncharacterized protein MVES1_003768 [Malassezia vespertilionis]PKI82902.1 hypothetical protein MVES_003327 [Malassezia vespertilionis]WFD08396.1 hypothetical protein MVES1_003768 [Malassezia vespertilionis]
MSKAKVSASDMRPRPKADEWKKKPVEELSLPQRVIISRNVLIPNEEEFEYPKSKGMVPVYSLFSQHMYLLPRAMLPIVARWAYMTATGYTIHPVAMYFLTLAYNAHVVKSFFQHLTTLVKRHGFLDADIPRDSIPETMAGKLFTEFLTGIFVRPLLVILLSYDRYKMPSLSLWLPLQVAIFTLFADFVYYWVHRATHEVSFLWHFHQRHHTTKHPVAYLLGFADEPQEVFDAIGSPILAYLMYPIGYDAMYIWSVYFIATEILGHSGMRAYYPGPLTSTILRPIDCEIAVEDHDLHHRFGWRESYNYGKQSRFWDAMFGTTGERVETHAGNIDYSRGV